MVRAYEPYKIDAQIRGVITAPTLESALSEAQLILLLVAHRTFCQLQPEHVAALTSARLLVDAVNTLPEEPWMSAGFTLFRLGASAEGKRQLDIR
jgi:UDP-N-acetyl-D-mannosaminuronate dehydrogenase